LNEVTKVFTLPPYRFERRAYSNTPQMRKTTPPPAPELDERGVRAAVERLAAAWNARDAAALAQGVTEDVSLVGLLGERYDGREIVELSYRHVFDTILKGARGIFTVEQIKFLKPDVAVAIVHQKVTSHLSQAAIASTLRQREISDRLYDSEARTTLTLIKRNNAWAIAALHNTLVASVVTGQSR
jgi:uncharacterized protein (TIGR02246 family)